MLKGVNRTIVQIGNLGKLRHLAFNHTEGKVGTIDRGERVKAREEMAASANMVEVGVGKTDSFYLVFIIL